MSRTYISLPLRRAIAREARYRCGYCLSPELLSGLPLTIDHLIPLSVGGSNEPENLWLACRSCNESKGNRTVGIDRETGMTVPLFNPRTQSWYEHFQWDENGTHILGLTPIGRVTVTMLNLNHEIIVMARGRWVTAGWHPPAE
jgi:hypothetical protein